MMKAMKEHQKGTEKDSGFTKSCMKYGVDYYEQLA